MNIKRVREKRMPSQLVLENPRMLCRFWKSWLVFCPTQANILYARRHCGGRRNDARGKQAQTRIQPDQNSSLSMTGNWQLLMLMKARLRGKREDTVFILDRFCAVASFYRDASTKRNRGVEARGGGSKSVVKSVRGAAVAQRGVLLVGIDKCHRLAPPPPPLVFDPHCPHSILSSPVSLSQCLFPKTRPQQRSILYMSLKYTFVVFSTCFAYSFVLAHPRISSHVYEVLPPVVLP